MIKKMLWIIYSIQRKRYKSILNLKYRRNRAKKVKFYSEDATDRQRKDTE